jgi:hypothetical protein
MRSEEQKLCEAKSKNLINLEQKKLIKLVLYILQLDVLAPKGGFIS